MKILKTDKRLINEVLRYKIEGDLISNEEINLVDLDKPLYVTGCIKAGEYIRADKSIRAGEFIEASGYIDVNGFIEAGRYISSGWYIDAYKCIKAGGRIKSG